MAQMPTSAHEDSTRLTFDKLCLQVDVTFWMELRRRKLSDWMLEEPTVPLRGLPSAVIATSDESVSPPQTTSASDVVLSHDSFYEAPYAKSSGAAAADGVPTEATLATRPSAFLRPPVPGWLTNYNLLSTFNSTDASSVLFSELGERLLAPLLCRAPSRTSSADDIAAEREAEAAAWRSAPFVFLVMLAYTDAKSYVFHHREGFPVLSFADSPLTVCRHYSEKQGEEDSPMTPSVARRARAYNVSRAAQYGVACLYSPFLCVLPSGDAAAERKEQTAVEVDFFEFSPTVYVELVQRYSPLQVVICFHDTASGEAGGKDAAAVVGWPIRNFLVCLRLAVPTVSALALYAMRGGGGGARPHSASVFLECVYRQPVAASLVDAAVARVREGREGSVGKTDWATAFPFLRATGWRKTGPQAVVSLGKLLNPASLAEEGSRLNLELMKWRQLPSLELADLSRCKALVLGTGTLGCNVARGLLMWGVRHLTLVDRGTVHYSNLARQSLFTADDAAQGRQKTQAAAAALRAILPTVDVTAATMTIHMPGHRTDTDRETETKQEIESLARLIQAHDVVFLLTDSREARWLPTVLAAAHNTPVVNAALGFDTYVVMRHGMRGGCSDGAAASAAAADQALGCYFCSDVVAPTDSLSARALDQQCTVTRPGVSALASAIAVELLAAVYQHPLRFHSGVTSGDSATHRLGALPQQIRGSVFDYSVRQLVAQRNPCCTACSDAVISAYRRDGADFLLRCVNDPAYIETVSGVAALKAQWEAEHGLMEWSTDSDGDA